MCFPTKTTPESIKYWLGRAQELREKGEPLYRWYLGKGYYFDWYPDFKTPFIVANLWREDTSREHGFRYFNKKFMLY